MGDGVGVLLDLAYMHICAKQFSLPMWEPAALCAAVLDYVSGQFEMHGARQLEIRERWACDSSLVEGAARADGLKKDELKRLRESGFELELHDDKHHAAAQGREVQGAVDVALACRLLWLAGAFNSGAPRVKHCVFFAGDSDFRPAIQMALAHSRAAGLRIWICARSDTLAHHYKGWLSDQDGVSLIPMREVLGVVAKRSDSDGAARVDLGGKAWRGIDAALDELRSFCANDDVDGGAAAAGARPIVLMVNHCRIRPADVGALASFLAAAPRIAARLSQLWMHHNFFLGPASGDHFARIVARCPRLAQLHVSDTQLDASAVDAICVAAARAGCGRGGDGGGATTAARKHESEGGGETSASIATRTDPTDAEEDPEVSAALDSALAMLEHLTLKISDTAPVMRKMR
jgi:hypothetical protein